MAKEGLTEVCVSFSQVPGHRALFVLMIGEPGTVGASFTGRSRSGSLIPVTQSVVTREELGDTFGRFWL